jgi:hypothetical protein
MALFLVVAVVPNVAFSGDEGLVSDASELGYRAGAMAYCKDHAGEDANKYNLLAISTLKDLDKLPSEDKAKALLVKKSVERKGEYLGKKLDNDRCESLRKTYSVGEMIDGKD